MTHFKGKRIKVGKNTEKMIKNKENKFNWTEIFELIRIIGTKLFHPKNVKTLRLPI